MEGRLYRILTIIMLLPSPKLMAQQVKDFTYYNELTYDLYQKKEWDQLIETGLEALDQPYDFYYLRTRIGIAYYEKGIYTSTIRHLTKALTFNSSEPVILEYLYYAYIHASRYSDAVLLYHQNKQVMKNMRLSFKPRFVDAISVEAACKISDHNASYGTEVDGVRYGQIGLWHRLGGHLSLYHYAGIMDHTFTDIQGNENSRIRYSYNFYQFDYYAGFRFNPGKGIDINPVFHFIGVDANSRQYTDLFYGIGMGKRFGKVRIGIQYGHGEINESILDQWIPEIRYYPFGNNKLYLSASTLWGSGNSRQQVYMGQAGVRIFPGTWLEGFIAAGKSQFIALFDGTILFNNPDYLLSRSGASLDHYLTDTISLSLYYIAEIKEQIVSGDRYTHHVIALGLYYKF